MDSPSIPLIMSASRPNPPSFHSTEEEFRLIDLSSSLGDFEKELQTFATHLHQPPSHPFPVICGLCCPSALASPPKKQSKSHQDYKQKEEIRAYPKISRRSRLLAEKADERFFARHNIKPVDKTNGEKAGKTCKNERKSVEKQDEKVSFEEKIPEKAVEIPSKLIELEEELSVEVESPISPGKMSIRERIEAYLAAPDETPPHSGPRKPSIFERGLTWLEEKERKIQSRRSHSACTFYPVIYTKIPHHLHNLSSPSLLEFISQARASARTTPISQNSEWKRSPVRAVSVHSERKSFSPVVQKLAFASGCDWEGLVQRGTELG